MALDTSLVFAVSLAGIAIITGLVVIVNLLAAKENKEKNHQNIQ